MELTIQQLVNSTRKYSPKRVDNLPTIKFDSVETRTFQPGGFLRGLIKQFVALFTQRRSVVIRSVAKSESTPDETYETVIVADGMRASGNQLLEPINAATTPVKVRCTCQDFRWRFAPYNFEQGCLYGPQPEPYEKKTNRPPVNPDHIPGMCKHLLNAVEDLKAKNLIK